ncbi:DSBA-like thioredoxin domain-containing protein [Allofrancisella inopinata]|uniref:Disulfide bond formation protein DsbA n=1 Tax=Allofrancisella inopinata TaxID=1085647 RepID=A0AAE6YJJ0_9GAMM|nr:DsbA family protein [Allofrancisella inopinata]QIV95949.1 disulfide bond formation protein DsbA [Allofrancisella inopinata]TDT74369.1 DSBA-like thioredoxin domain-containing protein [Allofrancisella inopinata]
MTKKKLLKALAVAIITTSLVACSGSSDNNDETTSSVAISASTANESNLDNVKSDASYTIGYGMGSHITQDPNLKDYSFNSDKVIAGFEDAINGKKPAISQKTIDNSMKELRDSLMQKMSTEQVTSFLKVKDSIYNSDLTPKTDIKDPAVVIYEFFDYQCMYCSKVAPEIEKAIVNHKDVQIAFVEFPIFGQRAPASEYAAEVGTAIYKIYGAKAYVKYHNGIFATGEDEGKLKNSTIDNVAKSAGADITKVKQVIKNNKISEHLQDTLEMGFKDLEIQGTPFLVIAPAKKADDSNTTIIGGYTEYSNIEAAIAKAKA